MRPGGAWRAFSTAAWLGWQIESNWADPLLFAIYSVVKPLATASILVVMYAVITKGAFGSPVFPWIYVGNALYFYVGSLLAGISWSVIDDRERYRALKYVYVSPAPFPLYLLARGVARLLTGSLSVWITVLFGVVFLKVRIGPAHFDPALFAAGMALGVVMLSAAGLMLAGATLMTAQHSVVAGEAVAGGLFLFSGAAFPLGVLPGWMQAVARALPFPYWLELTRRSLLGPPPANFGTFAALTNGQLLAVVAAATAGTALVAAVVFRGAVHMARERGLLDRVSNY